MAYADVLELNRRQPRRDYAAPAWYLGVRAPLTVLIEVAFLVALVAGARG